MKKSIIALFLTALLVLTGCSGEKELTFTAMDTVISLRAYGSEQALQAAESKLYYLEDMLSRTLPNSDISRINSGNGESVEVSPDTANVISAALEAYRRTGGAFDMTVAPVMDLWDFSGVGRIPSEEELSAALEKVGSENIMLEGLAVTASGGAAIDLGGIAKGYAGDVFRQVMEQHGVESALAYLGGNVVLVGTKPGGENWRVAVQDPEDENAILGVISAANCSVVTSGGYQRNFTEDGKTYHHIIDPKTGRSSESGLLSVTVVCENGATADALSTALFVMGEEEAEELWRESDDFEMLLVTQDGRVLASSGLTFDMESEQYEFYSLEK